MGAGALLGSDLPKGTQGAWGRGQLAEQAPRARSAVWPGMFTFLPSVMTSKLG